MTENSEQYGVRKTSHLLLFLFRRKYPLGASMILYLFIFFSCLIYFDIWTYPHISLYTILEIFLCAVCKFLDADVLHKNVFSFCS